MSDSNKNYKFWDESPFGKIGCMCPIYIAIVFVMCFFFSSCATKTKIEYVDRDVVKYEKVIQHDTLINNIHDSVYYAITQKGDTVYETKYVYRNVWRDRVVIQNDTCWRDSVVTEYKESVKEVVKYPKSYWYAIAISIIFFIFAGIKLVRWIKWL